jgi:hypothetical protein
MIYPTSTSPAPSPFPDWPGLLEKDWSRWQDAVKAAKGGPRILIATSIGGFSPGTVVESMLAVALTLRGAQVHILLCDELLPACLLALINEFPEQEEFARYGPSRRLCKTCFAPAYKMFQSLDLVVHRYSDFITDEERQAAQELSSELPYTEIGDYRLDGLAVGEHALAGALRFYARGNLDGEPHAEAVLQRYFHASLLTTYVARRLLNTYPFANTCFHHGIYVPQGLIGEVARQQNVRVVNWNPAYRKLCFLFSHHDTYHYTMLAEPTANWENMIWTPEMESEILAYLKSRWQGTQDWIWFFEKPQEELAAIAAELGVDFSRPCIGMLTNVMWDAQLHFRESVFPNMLEWTLQTISYFARRPELQLIIRVHPGEIRGTIPSRQPLVAEIERAFPTLPDNVLIIRPESEISTYAVMLQCNAVIIYGTKTGVELASMGIPVIVSGDAWIRYKGFAMDARSCEEYFRMLDRLPLAEPFSEAVTQRARKYAYHFFFRRMIPLEMMEPISGWPPYRIQLSGIDDLRPGRSPGLDVICDGILNGTEFIYPAESYLETVE